MVNVVETLVRGAITFFGGNQEDFKNRPMSETEIVKFYIFALLMVLIYLILVLLFGKVLWNSCLCELLPVKKCRSVWHILGLMILLGLLLPSSSK